MKAIHFLFSCFSIFILASCGSDLAVPGTTATIIADMLPEFNFSSMETSRLMLHTDDGLSREDLIYLLQCPPLTGFVPNDEIVSEGQIFTYPFLDITVTVTVSTFINGTNGINSGIRFSGTFSDSSGSILVEVDPDTGIFYLEQSFFLADNSRLLLANYDYNAVALMVIPAGTITSDGSAYGPVHYATYSYVPDLQVGALEYSHDCELYAGTWSEGSTLRGAGQAMAAYKNILDRDNFPSYGVDWPRPSGSATIASIPTILTYLKKVLAEENSEEAGYAVNFKESSTADVFRYEDGTTNTWPGSITPTSSAELKAALPSELWKAISQF